MYNLPALLLNPLPQQPAEQYQQNKKVSVDEVCQLLLMILVSETYVTEADVSSFSPPGFFLMCFMPILFFTLQDKKKNQISKWCSIF